MLAKTSYYGYRRLLALRSRPIAQVFSFTSNTQWPEIVSVYHGLVSSSISSAVRCLMKSGAAASLTNPLPEGPHDPGRSNEPLTIGVFGVDQGVPRVEVNL
jgi:hypothetical protein